jgi:hypothetical protein
MFKHIAVLILVITMMTTPANAELGKAAPWGTVEQEMQYGDQRTPYRPHTLPKDLSPAAVLQANKMWCLEIYQNTERAVYSRMGVLWANVVEHNVNGRYFHSDVHELDWRLRQWYTAVVDNKWRALFNNTKLDYRQCLEMGVWHVKEVEGAIDLFLKDYDRQYQR